MVRPATSDAPPATVGTAGVVDGRWINEAVYRRAVKNATDTNRQHLLELYDGYKTMSVRTPFRDLLSAEQRASYFFIDRPEQWDAVAERFRAEVDKYRCCTRLVVPSCSSFTPRRWPPHHVMYRLCIIFLHANTVLLVIFLLFKTYQFFRLLSFDSESVLSTGGASTPLRYGIFSTFSGTTAVFDFHRLAGSQPHFRRPPLMDIPDIFTTWLEEPGIVVLGADVAGDASVAGADATSCLDTRVFFDHMRRSPDVAGDNPVVNIYGIGNRSGLGVQAYWAKGYDHKPQPETTFVRTYGQHRYFAAHSARLRWPWWRRAPELYRWTRGTDGGLRDVHHFYMWCDGTTPMSLLHRVLLTLLIRNPWCTTYEDRSLTERIHHFIAPYVRQPPPPRRRPHIVDLSRDEGEITDSSDSDPPPPTTSRPVPLDWRPLSPDAPSRPETPALSAGPSSIPSPPRTVLQLPVWGPAQKFKAAWDMTFRTGDRCAYCAADTHVFSTKEGRPICPRYHAGEVYTCQYKYCNSGTLHCTRMCPVLHNVCPTCYTRGHSPEQRCEEWTEEEWARRRDGWEAVADLGLLTTDRHRIWNQGFFYHRRFTAWPFPFESYLHMVSVPVLRVLAILRDWANGIAPLPPTRTRPSFHDEPRPRSKKRPPPQDSQYVPGPPLAPLARASAEGFLSGQQQPRPVHPVGASLAAAPERRRTQQAPPPASAPPPAKRIKQAIVRRVPRVRQESPPVRARRARSPTRAIVRPVARAVSVPPRPDFSRPPPSAAAGSSSSTPRLIVLPPLNVPPPPSPAPTPSRRRLLPLPPSPPRACRSSSSSSSSEAVDLDVRPEDRLD